MNIYLILFLLTILLSLIKFKNKKKKNMTPLIILLLIIVFILFMKRHRNEIFTDYKYDTEIHFLTLWEKNNIVTINRINEKLKEYPHTRILKKIIIKKENINDLFKYVSSGGKHNKHDVEVLIIEAPNIYKINKTHDHPDGENVNDIMYNLKKTARIEYKNYKIAYSSFNIREANHFFKEYFKFKGDFNNYEEVINELNNSNLFWFFDRVTVGTFGKESDVDLFVGSIPSACFLLRNLNIHNKCYCNVNGTKKLFDLRCFTDNYYPKKWLEDIKNKNKITTYPLESDVTYMSHRNLQGAPTESEEEFYLWSNSRWIRKDKNTEIKIPEKLNHFMLGLYHLYNHKNGKQSAERKYILTNMGKELKKNIDINTILRFLVNNKYIIEPPKDKKVGNFIKHIGKDKGAYGASKKVFLYNDKYYYVYNGKEYYNKEKNIYDILKEYNITPKVLQEDNENNILVLEKLGDSVRNIGRKNIDKLKIYDFKNQIENITNILNNKNIIHNDITRSNILINNKKIYLIDFEHAITDGNKKRIRTGYSCHSLPFVKNKTFTNYLNNNKCLNLI